MRFRLSGAFLLALAGAVTISCGGIVDPSQNVVETKNGTIAVGGNVQLHFNAASTGELTVKVLSLTPASTAVVGVLWVDQASDGSCSGPQRGGNQVGANVTAISSQVQQGPFCIVLYDAGFYTAPETYSISVSHP
jgi:hypothetical protein